LKQFQKTKKAIHPLLIEVGDFLLDIVKKQEIIIKIDFFNIIIPPYEITFYFHYISKSMKFG